MQPDKKKHLLAGAIISIIGGAIYFPLVALGFASGYVKEWIDSKGYGQVDEADITYTSIGAAIGTTIIAICKIIGCI